MPRGEKLFRFLASLMLDRFYGRVTIRFEAGKVTHVEAESRRAWTYGDLPGQEKAMAGMPTRDGAAGARLTSALGQTPDARE